MFGAIGSIFGRGFLISIVAPAALFCGIHVLAARAGALPPAAVQWWTHAGGTGEKTFLIAVGAAALLLHTLSYFIVRVYEGYGRGRFYTAAAAAFLAAVPL